MSGDRRVAVVTGGGSGIGQAICARLADDGFALAVLDVDLDAASAAAGRGSVADTAKDDWERARPDTA